MSEILISNNVKNIELSGIRKFYNKVSEVEGAISLTLGQPDFPVPEGVKGALIKAINEDKTGYTSNAGILELREEICKYLVSQSINYKSDEVCITVGGSEGLMDVFTVLINAGDKVLIPTPAYPAYESCVKILGGQIINYELNQNDFSIDFEKLEKLIEEENPKFMVVSYPCNPTGAVLAEEARDKLHEIIRNRNIVVVTDEMYSAINFKDNYYSIAQFEDIKDKVILVSGFSKMFSMTGLRVGYICASGAYMNEIMKVHQYNVSCAPSISQYGALEGLKSSLNSAEKMKEEFRTRRDYLYKELIKLGFEVNLPDGAFYMFPSIRNFKMTSEEFCNKLLQNGKVAIVPGSAFGKGGEGFARISYAYSMDQLVEATTRIEKEIDKWK